MVLVRNHWSSFRVWLKRYQQPSPNWTLVHTWRERWGMLRDAEVGRRRERDAETYNVFKNFRGGEGEYGVPPICRGYPPANPTLQHPAGTSVISDWNETITNFCINTSLWANTFAVNCLETIHKYLIHLSINSKLYYIVLKVVMLRFLAK